MTPVAYGQRRSPGGESRALRSLLPDRPTIASKVQASRRIRHALLHFVDADPRASSVAIDTPSDAGAVWRTGAVKSAQGGGTRLDDGSACLLSRTLVELSDDAQSYLAALAVASTTRDLRLLGRLVTEGFERHRRGAYGAAIELWKAQAQQLRGDVRNALGTYSLASQSSIAELRRAALSSGALLAASVERNRDEQYFLSRVLEEERGHQLSVLRAVARVRARRIGVAPVNASVRRLASSLDHCYDRPGWAHDLMQCVVQ